MKHLILFCLILLIMTPYTYAKKTFIYCSEGSPTAFNPQVTTDGTSNNATRSIYETLLSFDLDSGESSPGLATSWKVSKDRKTYIFNLRKNVKFHQTKYFKPTRDFNADDVLFSFNRQLDKNHYYNSVGGGSYEYFNSMDMNKLIKSVKKRGDHKIEIILTRPEAPFLANLTMTFMSILSKEYADHLVKKGKKELIDNMPIGTGPFVFKKYVKDTLIRYQKNNHYWGTPAKVDRLVFAITPDASVRYQKLKAGECHLVTEPSPADIAAMKRDKKLKVLRGEGFNVGYLAMNTSKKPFDNVLVRKAINHILNKDSYIDAIYLGNAVKAKNPLPPSIWSYNKKVKDYKYNIKKAKSLLTSAGYPQGFSTQLWTLPVNRPYNPNGKKMGEMMQADLAKIGIKVKLVSYDWPTYLKKARLGEHQLIQLGWTGDNGDPDNFLHVLLGCSAVKSGSNVARWCNKSFNKLIVQAKTITNQKKRAQLYRKAQVIFKDQAPWATLAHSVVFRAMAKNVKGFKIDPLGRDILDQVDLK